MVLKDIIVFLLFIACNVGVSIYLAKKIKNSSDFFTAGRSSTWWLSGLSSFMTMFSAATFVVWGGIAFQYGMVAVTILVCLGLGAFFVAGGVAVRWRKMGINTAAEFINNRFGQGTLQFYTWFNIAYRVLSLGVSLYAVSKIIEALFPVDLKLFLDAMPFASALNVTIFFCSVIIIVYAITGGLWSVIITNVLQFVVLMVAVSVVIPLGFIKMGGVAHFINNVPEGFFRPINGEFGFFFFAFWIIIHYLKLGGEWAFIQQNIAVPTPKDAKKATNLFGFLFVVSPFIWMLPPMMYRVINPLGNPEEAYILACKFALPTGLIGLIVAAMFSATSGHIAAEINAFAGVLTHDIFKKIFPKSTEKSLVKVGRIFTLVIGILIAILAVLVPLMGGAREIILSATSLISGPMLLPVIWGLYSKKITQKSIFLVIIISSIASILLKFGIFNKGGFLVGESPSEFIILLQQTSRTLETAIGVLIPLMILLFVELTKKEQTSKFISSDVLVIEKNQQPQEKNYFAAKIIGWAVSALSVLFIVFAITEKETPITLWTFGIVIGLVGLLIIRSIKKLEN